MKNTLFALLLCFIAMGSATASASAPATVSVSVAEKFVAQFGVGFTVTQCVEGQLCGVPDPKTAHVEVELQDAGVSSSGVRTWHGFWHQTISKCTAELEIYRFVRGDRETDIINSSFITPKGQTSRVETLAKSFASLNTVSYNGPAVIKEDGHVEFPAITISADPGQ